MPALKIFTNITKDKIPHDFVHKATTFLSQLVGIDKKYIRICVITDLLMLSNGEEGPCAQTELAAVDIFGKEQNKRFAEQLFTFYKQELGLEPARVNIIFNDPGKENYGANGTTMA